MGTEGTHLYGDRAPHNLQYVVLVASSNLTQERVLTGTSNQITVTDNGAGSTVVLSTPQDIHTGASPTFAGITLTAAANISFTNTVAAGESLIDCHIIQGDDDALTGTLRGAYITASNGDEVATGTIRGVEIKARAGYPGETGANVNVLEGFSISSDAKTYDITTHRGGEIILDGGAGTSTLAVGLRIANNFQANRATTSYGLQLYRDSFDYTADIQLSSGGLIGGSGGDLFITDDGKIGIGTAVPSELLDINGVWPFMRFSKATVNKATIGIGDHYLGGGGAAGLVIRCDDGDILFGFAGAEKVRFKSNGNVGIGTATPNQPLTIEGTMSLKEQAAANADTVAYGQLWVKNAAPCELWFTDDAGADTKLA